MAIKIKNSTIIDDSRNLVDVGISTVTSLNIGSNEVISSSRQLKNIASLDAVTTATIESAIVNAPNTFTDLNVTGISTLNVVEASSLNVTGIVTASGFNGGPLSGSSGSFTQVNVSGIGTIATLDTTNGTIDYLGSTNINASGIVTAGTFSGDLENTLTLNTSGTGLSGSTTFNNSGASTFTVTSNATSNNTGGTLVARDGSGNFSAGTITANLSGTATTTTNIPNLSGDVSSNNTVTTLATVNSNVGTYGGTTAIPVVTVNGKGLVTAVSTVSPNNGTLTLGVSGTGLSGSATFTANQSGGSTFTVTSNATSNNTASTIVSRDASGNFSAGIITADVDATTVDTDNLNIGTQSVSTTTSTSVSTTSPTTIDSFAVATYRSARIQVQITQGTDYQTSDVLVIHDGSTASVVEYGSIATNDYLGTFSATVSGGNCLLQINMGSATSATVKVLSQRITV